MTPQITTEVAVPVRSYADLIAAFDTRRKALGLNLEELSEMAGLTDRYCNKIICHMRGLGGLSFAMMTCALGVEFVAYEVEPENQQQERAA